MTVLVLSGIALVIAGFFCLALTDTISMRNKRPELRFLAVVFWLVVVVAGWSVLGYVAVAAPGGLDAAVEWVGAQSQTMKIAMWVFLLPWMGSISIWQTTLSEAVRTGLILGVALLTLGLGLGQFGHKGSMRS